MKLAGNTVRRKSGCRAIPIRADVSGQQVRGKTILGAGRTNPGGNRLSRNKFPVGKLVWPFSLIPAHHHTHHTHHTQYTQYTFRRNRSLAPIKVAN